MYLSEQWQKKNPVIENFTLDKLAAAHREQDVWRKVIYALESGDETELPSFLVPFLQIFLVEDKVLSRYWAHKKESVAQVVIPEYYAPGVLQLVHDGVIAGHPGKERTHTSAHKNYYWPAMRVDTDLHVTKCVKCVQNKGTVHRPAPILEYPPPDRLTTTSRK